MKYFFIFSMSLLFLGCAGSEENYASISNEEVAQQASTAQKDIQSVVSQVIEQSKNKVGRETKKGVPAVDIKETVGGKNLRKTEPAKKVKVTKVQLDRNLSCTELCTPKVDKPKVQKPKAQKPKVQKPKVAKKKLDILFYMDKRNSKCVEDFVAKAKAHGDFLNSFSKFDWHLSISLYSDQVDLMPLEYQNGRAYNVNPGFFSSFYKQLNEYVLSSGYYSPEKRNRIFITTLTKVEYLSEENGMEYTKDYKGYVNDPISGLDRVLTDSQTKGFVRGDADNIVVLFGEKFPYYTEKEWNHFLNQHKNTKLFSISPRNANISNFLHVLERKDRFQAVLECSPEKLIESLEFN